MCSNCENVLHKYPFKHYEAHCPWELAQYCSYCSSYGHTEIRCSNRPTIKTRKPLQEKTVNTSFQRPKKVVMEITKDDRIMRHFLASQGESIAGKIDTLTKKVETWAKKHNYDGIAHPL